MGGRSEGHDPKDPDRHRKIAGQLHAEGQCSQQPHHRKLHRQNDPLLRFEHLEESRPERLQGPDERDVADPKRDVCIIVPEVLEHRGRHPSDHDVGNTLGEVSGRDPRPRIAGVGGRLAHSGFRIVKIVQLDAGQKARASIFTRPRILLR